MPCDTRTETTLELADPNPEILRAALIAVGFWDLAASGTTRLYAYHDTLGIAATLTTAGTLTVSQTRWSPLDSTAAGNVIRRAYSAEVVKQAARRYHWTLKQPDAQRQAYIAERR